MPRGIGIIKPPNKEVAEKMSNMGNMFMRGLKNSVVDYGKNVVGGAKIVGEEIGKLRKNPPNIIKNILEPVVKSKVREINKQKRYEEEGKKLNSKYSR